MTITGASAQIDHPHLHRPWHALHPCQTAARMRLLLAADAPTPGPGALPAERSGACTAGSPAAEASTDPARSGGDITGRSGSAGLRAGGTGGSSSLRYMLAWYCLVAPALGLPVPLALWTS